MHISKNKNYLIRNIIYVYLMVCVIPGISEYGIKVTNGIKISITDFLIVFILILLLPKKKFVAYTSFTLKHDRNNGKSLLAVFYYSLIFGLFSIMINDLIALRIIRNIFYVFANYLIITFVISNEDNITLINKIAILSTLISLSNIYIFVNKFNSTNLYGIFRSNETFLISTVCFFIFYVNTNKLELINTIIIFSTIVLEIMAIIVQQERTQIVSFLVVILIIFLYKMFNKEKWSFKIVKIFRLAVLVSIIFVIVNYYYNNNIFFNGLINNYINNRVKIIYNDGSFNADMSLSIRKEEFNVIWNLLSNNTSNFFFGKGLGAHYQIFSDDMFVVDSMWLWIFLNLGLIGLILFLIFFVCLLFSLFKIDDYKIRIPLVSYFMATLVMSFFTPNFFYRIDDGISFSILMAITFKFKTLNGKAENVIKQNMGEFRTKIICLRDTL